ncbi:MAG: DUF2752 domain-containing protein [Bacteroidetes bacterium]|nr:DUF2752 domain-containing protein [Bacteroidota bacterium]
MERNKISLIIKRALLVIILVGPFILIFLPANYFDSGQSICLSIRLFNLECLGCGLTRAIMHLIHFDINAAWNYNKLSFIIFPILVLFWINLFGKLIGKKYFTFFDSWY